jgi:16S rRNA (cytosine967-C5)-methyltransferase
LYPNSVSLTRTALGKTDSFPTHEATREGASFAYTFHTTNFVEFHTFPSKALERGHCYIQDPSTALACCLLDPQPGERVLDACAAPGGKTAYIAELMKNRGTILACDRNPERIAILEENLARLCVKIAGVALCDWERDRVEEGILSARPFDRILVDAPCTNTGVIRRRVDLRWRLRPSDFARMQARQTEIIRSVLPLLKPGGVLVYSTCSLEPEENEEVIRRILADMPILCLEGQQSSLPFRDEIDGAFAARYVRSI